MMATVATERGGGEPGRLDLAALHRDHYRSLVKLASLLIRDVATCEELVQEAFVQVAARPAAVRDPERAPAYLRSAVLNGARSKLRRRDPVPRLRLVSSTSASPEQPDAAATRHDQEDAVLAALRSLPDRQRDVLVLRYWMDLPEPEIAATLGIGPGTVKTHAKRGLAALAARLEDRR
jgi:RNA polymerase sigma-70 factor (sigma-E family)